MRNERAELEWAPTTFPSRRCPPQPFCAGTAPERSNPDGCGRAAAIGVSGSQVLGTEAPADPPDKLPERSCQVAAIPHCHPAPPRTWHNFAVPKVHPKKSKKTLLSKRPPVDALRTGGHRHCAQTKTQVE